MNPNNEVKAKLAAQKRNSWMAAISLSFLVLAVLATILAIILLPALNRETQTVVAYTDPTRQENDPVTKQVVISQKRPSPPSSAAASAAYAIVSAAPAEIAVNVSEIPMEDYGIGSGDFGSGMEGFGAASGGSGGGGGFGSVGSRPGALIGRLYDFKKETDGTDIPYKLSDPNEFVSRVLILQKKKFSESALSRHFQAPNTLSLTHLAIPNSPAAEGPNYFGAQDSIKPSGWIAHYSGKLTAVKSGSFRFAGLGDDYLTVYVDGRMRLCACWPSLQDKVAERWREADPSGQFSSPIAGTKLIFGDWLKVRAGEEIDLDLTIGERPGGMVGFVLLVEEKGAEYRKTPEGRPILPLFSVQKISEEEKSRITKGFGNWEVDWDRDPVFHMK